MDTHGAFFVTVLCIICRYYVYKELWTPYWIGVACFAGHENVDYRKDMAVTCPKGFVIGHLLCEISSLCFYFIKHLQKLDFQIFGPFAVAFAHLSHLAR